MRPIQQVQVGDQVLSRSPATGKDEAKTVTATIERHAPSVVDVMLHDARTGKAETLTCTPEHPLFVQGQGWVEAGSVGIGNSIVSRAGPALSVTGLTWEKNKAQELAAGTGSSFGGYTVYNLTVEDDHTFFVGSVGGGTWVHNACLVIPKRGYGNGRDYRQALRDLNGSGQRDFEAADESAARQFAEDAGLQYDPGNEGGGYGTLNKNTYQMHPGENVEGQDPEYQGWPHLKYGFGKGILGHIFYPPD